MKCQNRDCGEDIEAEDERCDACGSDLHIKPERRSGDSLASSTGWAATWQPIETLPRDGTPVLVWAEPMSQPDIAWHESTGMTARTYTHWMPLPKPPIDQDELRRGGRT